MLRPFFPELVMSTDLLRFEHPSVLLFCSARCMSEYLCGAKLRIFRKYLSVYFCIDEFTSSTSTMLPNDHREDNKSCAYYLYFQDLKLKQIWATYDRRVVDLCSLYGHVLYIALCCDYWNGWSVNSYPTPASLVAVGIEITDLSPHNYEHCCNRQRI